MGSASSPRLALLALPRPSCLLYTYHTPSPTLVTQRHTPPRTQGRREHQAPVLLM